MVFKSGIFVHELGLLFHINIELSLINYICTSTYFVCCNAIVYIHLLKTNCINIRYKMIFFVDIDADYIREMVYMLVDDLYVRNDRRSMVEQRLEDLETRVTQQSLNYQVKG